MAWGRRRWYGVGTAALLVAVGGWVAAPGGRSGPAQPASAPADALQPPDQAVVRAYLSYWDTWLAANQNPAAKDNGLSAHAAQPNLGVMQDSLVLEFQQGHTVKGTVDHHIEGMLTEGVSRRIVDCVDLNKWVIYDARTGRPIPQLVNRPKQLAVMTLRVVDGVWKVTDSQQPVSC